MAKTVVHEEIVRRQMPPLLSAGLIGLGAGLSHWLVALVLSRYVTEPMACREVISGAQCASAPFLAGDIAGVIIAVLALLVFVLLRQARPIVIVVSSMVLLWGVVALLSGLQAWQQAIGLIFLYGLSYVTFAWITRATRVWVTVTVALIVVVLGRVLIAIS